MGDVGSLQPLLLSYWLPDRRHDTPLTPERQQLPWGSPMAGVPHVRPPNLEQLPRPGQQLGPAGHKSLVTPAGPGCRLLPAVGGGEVGGAGRRGLRNPLPPPPNPTRCLQAPGGGFASCWANSSEHHSPFHTTQQRRVGLRGRLRVYVHAELETGKSAVKVTRTHCGDRRPGLGRWTRRMRVLLTREPKARGPRPRTRAQSCLLAQVVRRQPGSPP